MHTRWLDRQHTELRRESRRFVQAAERLPISRQKEDALETLRKIGKSICCSNGFVGREIRKGYQYDEALESTMLEIGESLTYEESERLRPWRDDKLVELQRNADGCCIFEGLGKVIQLWGGDEEVEGEGSSDNNEEGDSQSGGK